LERNASLSEQYLELFSRRYNKQVEMQLAFNQKIAEESRKGEECVEKTAALQKLAEECVENMTALQKQLATLSFSVQMLLTERDSWQHKTAVSN
jgi:glucose-6-phosphate-specific signal transduction histidine kinase